MSDTKHTITEPAVIPFKEALYQAHCPCGARLNWQMVSRDPDGPSWSANCCGRDFWMVVHCVKVWSQEEET